MADLCGDMLGIQCPGPVDALMGVVLKKIAGCTRIRIGRLGEFMEGKSQGAFALLVALCAMFGMAQEPAEKMLRQFRVPLPLTEYNILPVIRMWALATETAIGVECLFPAPLAATVEPGRVMSLLDLSGMGVRSSIEKMMREVPQYQARFTQEGVLILRLKGADALDQVVPRFSLTNASLARAAEAVRQILEPGYVLPDAPLQPPITGDTYRARQYREQYNERFKPFLDLDLMNVTVETVLTAIVRARGGGCSWMVIYLSDAKRIEDSLVGFYVPGGLQVTAGPQKKAPPK